MKIIIGRDVQTSELSLTIDGNASRINGAGTLPHTVSRQHVQLIPQPNGTYQLTNLKAQNTTYVNGLAVTSKIVSTTDVVQLGPDRYTLPWDVISRLVPMTLDVRHLQRIAEQYKESKMALTIKERKFNAFRSSMGVLTMLAMAVSFVPALEEFRIVLYLAAIIAAIVFGVISYKSAAEIPHRSRELDDKYRRDYVCPHCRRFLSMDYRELTISRACPYCKTKYSI